MLIRAQSIGTRHVDSVSKVFDGFHSNNGNTLKTTTTV